MTWKKVMYCEGCNTCHGTGFSFCAGDLAVLKYPCWKRGSYRHWEERIARKVYAGVWWNPLSWNRHYWQRHIEKWATKSPFCEGLVSLLLHTPSPA